MSLGLLGLHEVLRYLRLGGLKVEDGVGVKQVMARPHGLEVGERPFARANDAPDEWIDAHGLGMASRAEHARVMPKCIDQPVGASVGLAEGAWSSASLSFFAALTKVEGKAKKPFS